MGWSYGWGVLIGPIVGLVAVASAGDIRGAPTPAETLRDAAGELKAATDGALSEVHAVSSSDPSHSARPNIREYLLACRKKCDDKRNLPASFNGYVSESHCFLGCHWAMKSFV